MASEQTRYRELLNPGHYLPHLSVDCVIFGYRAGQMYVLIPQLDTKVVTHTLPGGFIRKEESIDAAALRVLQERTGVSDIFLEQFQVFGDADRTRNLVLNDLILENGDHLGIAVTDLSWLVQRFVSVGYYALVDMTKITPQKSNVDKSIDWHPLSDLPPLFLDHREIIQGGLTALQLNLDRKLIGFNLLPETFTMRELQELYEAVYDRTYVRANFQKRMLKLGVLERLGKKYTGASNKAPYLYRFNQPG